MQVEFIFAAISYLLAADVLCYMVSAFNITDRWALLIVQLLKRVSSRREQVRVSQQKIKKRKQKWEKSLPATKVSAVIRAYVELGAAHSRSSSLSLSISSSANSSVV